MPLPSTRTLPPRGPRPARRSAETHDAPTGAEESPEEVLARHHAAVDWDAIEPRGFYARFGRRALELAVICCMAPVALPIAAVVALLNAISSGSLRDVFFLQTRIGHRGRPFRIVKFRTMSHAPEGAMNSWSNGGDHLRVTTLGRLLRNTHLDELSQLWNVLRGDMHLIGPRPEMIEVEAWACEHVEGFSERLALHPGITGYAQIRQGYTGRDVAGYRKKLELCREYASQLSFRTDLLIVVCTALWMVRGKGWKWCQSADCQGDSQESKAAA